MTLTCTIVIPTRNRPEKLRKCLQALTIARQHVDFDVVAGDSTPDEQLRAQVQAVVESFPFARYTFHTGDNASKARNFVASQATGDVLVSIDDDVYVEPQSIAKLMEHFTRAPRDVNRIVGGTVSFGGRWTAPVKMRRIGYGRATVGDETPDFLISAFLAYRREVMAKAPWNEHIRTSEDRIMGATCRRAGIRLEFEPAARAFHDDHLNSYDVTHQRWHIYANLYDAIFSRHSLSWVLSFEVLGFLAGVKAHWRSPSRLGTFLSAWADGHRRFFKDYSYLKGLA